MKFFALILMPWAIDAFARQSYFTSSNKRAVIESYQKLIYEGCSDPKEKQGPVSVEQMNDLARETSSILKENFSKAFSENPKLEDALKKDLKELSQDSNCQKTGNNCRAKFLGISLFYYQQLRPDIGDCEKYTKKAPVEVGYKADCELELKYRKSNLQGVTSGYGLPGVGSYRKELIALKNSTTMQLFYKILRQDRMNLHICNPTHQGSAHKYNLDLNDPGQYLEGMTLLEESITASNKDCIDPKKILAHEFVPAPFDDGRSQLGLDAVEPVKKKILDLLKADPNTIVTNVSVTSFSSKTPYYVKKDGKSVIDPNSNEKNLQLSKDRGAFVQQILESIKGSSSQFGKIAFTNEASLAGPDFNPIDLNDRFVTKMSSGYMDRVEAMFQKNKKLFAEEALMNSSEDLYNEKKYVNLYQAKFKPFHGYRIIVNGYKKDEMKCFDSPSSSEQKSDKASRQ